MPATARGTISIDTGQTLVEVATRFGQPASATGSAVIPNGGMGATMVIPVGSHLAHLGTMSPVLHIRYAWVDGTVPPGTASRFARVLGQTLSVREVAGGSIYDGTWTRRAGTDVFDGVWNGSIRDVITIESVNGNQIVFYRQGNNGRYTGTLSRDGSIGSRPGLRTRVRPSVRSPGSSNPGTRRSVPTPYMIRA